MRHLLINVNDLLFLLDVLSGIFLLFSLYFLILDLVKVKVNFAPLSSITIDWLWIIQQLLMLFYLLLVLGFLLYFLVRVTTRG